MQFDHKSEVFHDTSLSQRKYYYCHLMTPGAKSTILEWQDNKWKQQNCKTAIIQCFLIQKISSAQKAAVNTMWSKAILSETVLFILLASVVVIASSLPYYRTLPSSRLNADKSTKEEGSYRV